MPKDINYVSYGEGEIVLLLHGWGQNKEMMIPLIENLKNNYKCIVLDLPGFGESQFNNSKSFDEYIIKLRGFLEEKKLLPKYIIGHSFGGKIAIGYQLKYGDLKKVIILSSPILKPKRTLKYYLKVLIYKIKKKLFKKINKGGSNDYRNCSNEMKGFFVNTVNTHYNKELAKLAIPILLIWGNEDQTVPLNKGRQLDKKLLNSKLYIIRGKHFAYLDNIQYTRLLIQKFLRRE